MTENIKIAQGDCLELMKDIPDKSIDLVIADPPYIMTKRGKSCRPNYMHNSMGENLFEGKIPQPKLWFEECYRILKDGTHFYVFCNINDLRIYLNAAYEVGFRLHNIITMIKDTKMPSRWYLRFSERVLFFRKGNAKPINDMTSRDYVNVTMPKKRDGKLHITQKPLDFITKLVTNSTEENEIVLDPFMGSGTTGVACQNTNRKFIGFELDKEYFEIAKNRLGLQR